MRYESPSACLASLPFFRSCTPAWPCRTRAPPRFNARVMFVSVYLPTPRFLARSLARAIKPDLYKREECKRALRGRRNIFSLFFSRRAVRARSFVVFFFLLSQRVRAQRRLCTHARVCIWRYSRWQESKAFRKIGREIIYVCAQRRVRTRISPYLFEKARFFARPRVEPPLISRFIAWTVPGAVSRVRIICKSYLATVVERCITFILNEINDFRILGHERWRWEFQPGQLDLN